MSVRIHPSAIVESGVDIGAGTSIWDSTHIRGPARIGRDCIIGEKTYIAYGVLIGDLTVLIDRVLGGELSARFVLKVLTVGTIAGTAFWYYLSDLRRDETEVRT